VFLLAERLEFLQTTAATLDQVTQPPWRPLIAHDRGNLWRDVGPGPAAWPVLLRSFFYGDCRQERAVVVVDTFCLAGARPAYSGGPSGVHLYVGYLNLLLLAPVFVAFCSSYAADSCCPIRIFFSVRWRWIATQQELLKPPGEISLS
jgi:hypothetical protein